MLDHWVKVSPLSLAQLRPSGETATAPAANVNAPAVPVANEAPATQSSTGASGSPVESATQPTKPSSPYAGLLQFAPIALMLGVLYFVMIRGQKKTEKNRKQMVSNMKKGDEVMTIGGLVARVVSVDDDEVVLKIDESANVKARYKKSSIQQVLTGDEKAK